MKGEFIHNRDQ